MLQPGYTRHGCTDGGIRIWKDKLMRKAAEGTSLGRAKMLLQNKSLRFSFLNTVFLSSQTGFLSPAQRPLPAHPESRAGTESHLGPGLEQPWRCLPAGAGVMNPNFARSTSASCWAFWRTISRALHFSPPTYKMPGTNPWCHPMDTQTWD